MNGEPKFRSQSGIHNSHLTSTRFHKRIKSLNSITELTVFKINRQSMRIAQQLGKANIDSHLSSIVFKATCKTQHYQFS